MSETNIVRRQRPPTIGIGCEDDLTQGFPVLSAMKEQPEPAYFAEMMDMFHGVLEDLQLPQLYDRSATPDQSGTQVCSVFLSMPDERLAPILEGGHIAPGTVFLALSHTWISRVNDELWLHRGISADATGQFFLDRFEPARRITYFANFFSKAASYKERCEGDAFFSPTLQTPTSSSPSLETYVNDKLYTRAVLARGLVSFPVTLAFGFRNQRRYLIRKCDVSRIKVVSTFTERKGNRDVIMREISAFVKRVDPEVTRFVVKPSGPIWMESAGVQFFDRADITGAVDHVERLLNGFAYKPDRFTELTMCQDGDSILVEEFLPTMSMQCVSTERDSMLPSFEGAGYQLVDAASAMLEVQELAYDDAATTAGFSDQMSAVPVDIGSMQNGNGNDGNGAALKPVVAKPLAFRLRVIVVINSAGQPTVAAAICGIGPRDQPLNGCNTVPVTFESALLQWGLRDSEHRDRIISNVYREGERVLQALREAEDSLTAEQRGGLRAHTDVVGIDFILAQKGGMIVPYVIEVNDHDCFFAAQQVECIIKGKAGDCVRAWLERQVVRSHDYLLDNTVVVVVGGGAQSKSFVFDETSKWGMKVILIDQNANHTAKHKVWKFVHFPALADHFDDAKHTPEIVRLVHEALLDLELPSGEIRTPLVPPVFAQAQGDVPQVHGVITFWEDCTVVATMIAKALGCVGNDPDAQHRVKNKFKCFEYLMQHEHRTQYLPPVRQFAAKVHRIEGPDDLIPAMKTVPLPAVIKLEYGSSAVGVKLVTSQEDLVDTYHRVQKSLRDEASHGGCGLGFNANMLLMEYLDGTEHDVDIVMFNGELVFAAVTDNAPTRMPLFCETAAVMPSQLGSDRIQTIVFAAHQVCRASGLRHGVFNVEMKYTATGPRLIEINGRMGGFYIRDWVKRLFGIDLLRCAFLCAFGVRPRVPQIIATSDATMVGVMMYASEHGTELRRLVESGKLTKLHENKILVLNVFEDHIPEEMEFEEPYCNIAAAGQTAAEAGTKILAICRTLQLDSEAKVPTEFYLRALDCI